MAGENSNNLMAIDNISEAPDPSHSHDTSENTHILVVDTNAESRAQIQEIFAGMDDRRVDGLADPARLIDRMASRCPEILIVNAEPNGADCLALLAQFKASRHDCDTAAIVIVDEANAAAYGTPIEQGAADCVFRSFLPSALLHSVDMQVKLIAAGRDVRTLNFVIDQRTKRMDGALDLLRTMESRLASGFDSLPPETIGETAAKPMTIEEVDVGGVIEEAAKLLAVRAERDDIALDVRIEPDLPIIETDKEKLYHMMVDLIANAIQFTPPNGRVLLTAKRNEEDGVLVLVGRDVGIGMTAEDLHDFMTPSHGDPHGNNQGPGLALPIAKDFVEMMGGRLDVRSKKGRGTSVRIELPMTIAGAASAGEQAE